MSHNKFIHTKDIDDSVLSVFQELSNKGLDFLPSYVSFGSFNTLFKFYSRLEINEDGSGSLVINDKDTIEFATSQNSIATTIINNNIYFITLSDDFVYVHKCDNPEDMKIIVDTSTESLLKSVFNLNALAFNNLGLELDRVVAHNFKHIAKSVTANKDHYIVDTEIKLDWNNSYVNVPVKVSQSLDKTNITSLIIEADLSVFNNIFIEVASAYGVLQDLYLMCQYLESSYSYYVTDLLHKAGVTRPEELPNIAGKFDDLVIEVKEV